MCPAAWAVLIFAIPSIHGGVILKSRQIFVNVYGRAGGSIEVDSKELPSSTDFSQRELSTAANASGSASIASSSARASSKAMLDQSTGTLTFSGSGTTAASGSSNQDATAATGAFGYGRASLQIELTGNSGVFEYTLAINARLETNNTRAVTFEQWDNRSRIEIYSLERNALVVPELNRLSLNRRSEHVPVAASATPVRWNVLRNCQN